MCIHYKWMTYFASPSRTRSKVKSYPLLREQVAGDCFFVSLTRQRVAVWFSKWPPHWLNAWKAVQGYLYQTRGLWKFHFKTRIKDYRLNAWKAVQGYLCQTRGSWKFDFKTPPQKSEHLNWSRIIIKKYSTNINSLWTWYWLVKKLLQLLKFYWETLCWSFLKALFACISECMGTI